MLIVEREDYRELDVCGLMQFQDDFLIVLYDILLQQILPSVVKSLELMVRR